LCVEEIGSLLWGMGEGGRAKSQGIKGSRGQKVKKEMREIRGMKEISVISFTS
jgi:hypothetical protein